MRRVELSKKNIEFNENKLLLIFSLFKSKFEYGPNHQLSLYFLNNTFVSLMRTKIFKYKFNYIITYMKLLLEEIIN